jgi:hypothetical protein
LTFSCLAGAPAVAAATESLVAPNCTAVVDGTPGQEVVLDPRSLADPIVGVLAGLDPLGLLAGPFREAWQAVAPIPIGAVPAGQAVIPGARIADAVTERLGELPVLALVLEPLTPAVRQTLSTVCGVLARGPLPSTPAPESPQAPGQTPGQTPGGTGAGTPGSGATQAIPYRPSASERYYQALLAGRPGMSSPVPGSQLGSLGGFGDRTTGAPQFGFVGPAAETGPERSAGRAQAMPAARDEVPAAVLAAVLLLAVVGAFLVRRWVRRARH